MSANHTAAASDEPRLGRSGPPALYNLVYCSRAAAGVDQTTVDHIVAKARQMNAQHQITGMLVFGAGVFFQWLEGPRGSVLALMALIEADNRHHDVIQLTATEEVRERLFPDWDMELVGSEHIREVLQDAHGSATEAQNKAALSRLLADLESGGLAELAAAGRH